jgi:hypothetical protein
MMKLLKSSLFGAVAAAVACTPAIACEIVHAYRYQMDQAAYALELNGVHIDYNAEPGDYFGGGPFRQWVAEGENTLTITLSKGSADISVIRACSNDFDGDTLVEASVSAPESRTLTFFVEGARKAVYDSVGPLAEDGLAEAVAALKAAVKARDFDQFWQLHEGLRIEATSAGFPEEQLRAMMEQTVANGEPVFRDDLVFKPVLGGRVWQVMTGDFAAPVTLSLDGGSMTVNTGAYWTKVDGQWRVAGT